VELTNAGPNSLGDYQSTRPYVEKFGRIADHTGSRFISSLHRKPERLREHPDQAAAPISRAMVEVGGGPFGPPLKLSGEVPASPLPVNNIRFFHRST
jgi:hypothetical protein